MPADCLPTVQGQMEDRAYRDVVASVRPELDALSRSEGTQPANGDENARMSTWVAPCLSALGEASEEASVNEDDEMARAADTREAMLGAGRIALDALEEVSGIDRLAALSMLEDCIATGGEVDPVDRRKPPSADMELEAAREEAVYQLALAAQAASEMPDAQLRQGYFVQGLVGFATIATGFARNVRRWAAGGE